MKESKTNFLVGKKEPTGTEWVAVCKDKTEADKVYTEVGANRIKKVEILDELRNDAKNALAKHSGGVGNGR